LAGTAERAAIYRLRHDVYACELRQHSPNEAAFLRDGLDDRNLYLVAMTDGEIHGFVSITPPGGTYSIDKYFAREAMPFAFDRHLYEARLLTVVKPVRGGGVASLLMYAAFRWVEVRGGTRIVAIGRREMMPMYLRSGLEPVGLTTKSGAVEYHLVTATVSACRDRLSAFGPIVARLERRTQWNLGFPFRSPAPCFHGGASVEAIGAKFESLHLHSQVINADVLDAWFPPSPRALSALTEHLPWLLRTSPPAGCEGLIGTIAEVRGLRPENIVVGAGSSDLMFRVLRHWIAPGSRALILDPTYGEYAHLLERVIGCRVDRLRLRRERRYDVDLAQLSTALEADYDLIVLVNPNSPTGRMIPALELQRVLRRAPAKTRIWLDETYIDFADPTASLEAFACASSSVVVCKSMSKAYALSGARVAYLCGGPQVAEELRAITPPWVVGLPAQVAAVEALRDPAYYEACYRETRTLREAVATQLRSLGLEVIPGVANFVLCHLPEPGLDAAEVVRRCRSQDLYLRDASEMGAGIGRHALRIAVKDATTNSRMVRILAEALDLAEMHIEGRSAIG
jgi:histidinol-phosphate/aromatic aminotransferase/cobyric acid decarboxylase-like protein/GNAT superfamily N-acetyltransferase